MRNFLAVILIVVSGAAFGDPLPDMVGTWSGTGWARQSKDVAQETVRCKIANSLAARALTIKGRCAVPGRKLHMSGVMRSKKGAQTITGHWFNPDGLGSTQISGRWQNMRIIFAFRTTDPETGAQIAQRVEWQIEGDTLLLRSVDIADPNVILSEVRFSR